MKKEASKELSKLIFSTARKYDTATTTYAKRKAKIELVTLVNAYNCMRDENESYALTYYYNRKVFIIYDTGSEIEETKQMIRMSESDEEIKKECKKENIDYDILSRFAFVNQMRKYIVFYWFTYNYKIMYNLIKYYLLNGNIFSAESELKKASISDIVIGDDCISFRYKNNIYYYYE